MITHEVTEAYEGGKIGQKKGKNDEPIFKKNKIYPAKTYSKAHSRASKQNDVFERSNSKGTEYYVTNGNGEETIILNH